MATTYRTEIRDGVEVGIMEHNGHTFMALGSVVTPEYASGYPKGGLLTNWNGDVIGSCRIVSSWRIYSHWSSTMHQIEARINGVWYTGRGMGNGMLWRGKRMRNQ